jgi:hypothetical protein
MTQYQVRAQRREARCRSKRRVRRFARVILAAVVILLLAAIGFWKAAVVCGLTAVTVWGCCRLAIFSVGRKAK